MKREKILKITSGAVLSSMLLVYSAPVFAFTKDETVYSKLDSSGSKYETIVSTHLINDSKENLLNDLSDLINIQNTKGEEEFTKNGNTLVWDADGNDIYYQGESEKELPVECKIKYEIDGKKVSAKDLLRKIW